VRNRARGLRVLLALAILSTVVGTARAADDLVGTWLPDDATTAILEQEPARVRLLVVKQSADGTLVAKLVVPTLAGMPIAVRRDGDAVHFSLRMARGMEQRFEARFTYGRLLIGGPGQEPVPMRRPTPEEARILERLSPKPLPLPAPTVLPANGLARTPPMGFSTWNHFAERIDDRTVREIADALVSTGLRDAGYVSVNIDDGWQGTRDASGALRPNAKFPDMKALADALHERGLKLGIYTSPGPKSCAGFEGSYGHEEQDARTFAAWGVDYVKYDWCSAGLIYDDADMPGVYLKMALALRATGRPIVFSLCQYGRDEVWTWGAGAGGNLWRTTGDIADRWDVMSAIGFEQGELSRFAGPGHWNDPDMLEVGNGGMTTTEYRTHVTLWAMLAAPLIAGHDVRKSSPETLALLTNRGVIAIDQDPLGRAGTRAVQHGPLEIWTRPLDGGRSAVALFNRGETPARVEAPLADVGLVKGAAASDVWAGRALPALDDRVAADVEPHGVVLLVVTPPGAAPAATPSAASAVPATAPAR
jgi:alpha-galactosidase